MGYAGGRSLGVDASNVLVDEFGLVARGLDACWLLDQGGHVVLPPASGLRLAAMLLDHGADALNERGHPRYSGIVYNPRLCSIARIIALWTSYGRFLSRQTL